MDIWLEKILERTNETLENALSFYSEGLFQGQFKKLQKMMKIFHCKDKEIFVVKEDFEENKKRKKGYGPTYKSKVDELVESMMVDVDDNLILSIDENFNNHLHSIKTNDSIMKMTLGKGEQQLNIYIRAIFDNLQTVDQETGKPMRSKIPARMLKHHFFEFFTSAELFKMRLVCKEWKETITNLWHGIFKREMHNHLLMSECTKEVEKNFKLMAVRQPVSQKFAIYATAISELLNWPTVLEMAEMESNYRRTVRLLLTSIVKFLNWEELEIENLSHYTDTYFNEFILPLIDVETIKDRIHDLVKDADSYLTLDRIHLFSINFLDYSEIWMSALRSYAKREIILMRLLCRHLSQFGILRNSMMVSKKFLTFVKKFIDQKKFALNEKKSFLEGAYKIMIFSNATIINGKVVTLDSSKFEENIIEGMRESIHVTNLLQNLFTNEQVLTTFLSENRNLIKEYFDTMELYKRKTREDQILERIEKEAKDVQGALDDIKALALKKIDDAKDHIKASEDKLEEILAIENQAEQVDTHIEENTAHEQITTQEREIEEEEKEVKEPEIEATKDLTTTYVQELIEKVNSEIKTDSYDSEEPIRINLENQGYVTIVRKDQNAPPSDLQPAFMINKKSSSIKIFMDSGATNKFLSDALRYLECVMQVKRLNMCLRMQFESVQNKLMDVERFCQNQIDDQSEQKSPALKVNAQIETIDLERREEIVEGECEIDQEETN